MIINEAIMLFFTGFIITIIGALPFGLVNLSVFNESLNKRPKQAMLVAYGASLVEVVYGTLSLFTGKFLMFYIYNNQTVKWVAIAVILATAIYFFSKKEAKTRQKQLSQNSFVKGLILNLVSVQVFIYWIVAIAVAISLQPKAFDSAYSWLLIAGIWPGKMAVLWIYKKLGERIHNPENKLARNMNQIIGAVLLIVAFIQIIKI